MKEVKIFSLQTAFCVVHEQHLCDCKVKSIKEVPRTGESADAGEKDGTQEQPGDLLGDAARQAEQQEVRETDNLEAVEETEAGGEPEACLVGDHPEHDDDFVGDAQRVFHPLEVDKLHGIQKQQSMQEKPGEAETQHDKIIVAQGLLPHHVPKIHQENESIAQNPHCKLQDRK